MKCLYATTFVVTSIVALSTLGEKSETDAEVNFYDGSFEEALAHAEQSSLPLFLYLTIPGCTPCEYMESQVFTDPAVGKFLNDRFVNFKLDAFDADVNGPTLAEKYNVGSYPTYMIVCYEGKILHRASTGLSPQKFIHVISWLTGEIDSLMEDSESKYAAGHRAPDFVQQYLVDSKLEFSVLLKDASDWEAAMKKYDELQEKYVAIAEEYLKSKSSEDLINSKDLSIIKQYCLYLDDYGIKLVMDNFDAYVKATSLAEVSGLLLEVIAYAAMTKASEGDATYTDELALLEKEPLKRATEWRRGEDPNSGQLPENLRDNLEALYSSATKESNSNAKE